MVDHAKLPNLVIVAVVGSIYFWRKVKASRDVVMKFTLNGPLSKILQSETFFDAKNRPKPFVFELPLARWSKFRRRGDEKRQCFSQLPTFRCFFVFLSIFNK